MTKHKRSLRPDEHELWRRVAATVKPRAQCKTAAPDLECPQPKAHAQPARKPALRHAVSLHAKTAEKHQSPAPQNRANEKRVRRGKLDIGATLDLHGHTQASGHAALLRFLRSAQRRGDAAAIVITGVGRAGEGVLKRRFPEWIAEPALRSVVSGYAPAHRSHGGAGAFYVFLRRPR